MLGEDSCKYKNISVNNILKYIKTKTKHLGKECYLIKTNNPAPKLISYYLLVIITKNQFILNELEEKIQTE